MLRVRVSLTAPNLVLRQPQRLSAFSKVSATKRRRLTVTVGAKQPKIFGQVVSSVTIDVIDNQGHWCSVPKTKQRANGALITLQSQQTPANSRALKQLSFSKQGKVLVIPV